MSTNTSTARRCLVLILLHHAINHSASFGVGKRWCYDSSSLSSMCEVTNTFRPVVPFEKKIIPSQLTLSCSAFAKGFLQQDESTTEDRLMKLDVALRMFNTSSASDLLLELRNIKDLNPKDPQLTDRWLDDLLSNGPDSPLPLWTKIRPIVRFSKRARLASLRRTLDATTPPPTSDNDENDSLPTKKDDSTESLDNDRQRRRRRAFISLLRTLSSTTDIEPSNKLPAIRIIEMKAMQANKGSVDLTLRRPTELETPSYDVLEKCPGGIEVRRYKPYSICSVSMTAPRPIDSNRTDAKLSDPTSSGGVRAFGALAGYLFGKNEVEMSMKMTTPVLTKGQGEGKEMAFVLPSEYWDDNGIIRAPKPLLGSGVELRQTESEDRAVLMFGGYASKKEFERNKLKLIASLSKEKGWEISNVDDTITLAQYNDPFTPPWKRLNEVSVAVIRRQQKQQQQHQ